MSEYEPTETERQAIIAKLKADGSRYTLADVEAQYNEYLEYIDRRNETRPRDLDVYPPFSAWLAASGWMDE